MLRNKQHSRKDPPPGWLVAAGADGDVRVEGLADLVALADLVDNLDLHSFLMDSAYRRRLNDVLSCFSDAEFDSFERLYTRRFTVN